LTLTNITGGTQTLSGFGSGGGGGSSITGGTFDVNTLELDLNSTGSTVTINNVTGLYISAGTYSSSTSTILLYNSTGGTINITGVTASGGSFTGGTVTGSTIFTNGLSANTISATTYQNLPQSVSGTGTQDYVTKWDGSLVGLVDSQIYDTGGFIGIATTTPLYSETLSIQTGNQGITIDALYIRDAGGSLAFGTNFDYSAWGSGGGEIAIGTRGVLSNSTGSGNIGIGDKALESNTTGINNIAIGGTGALTYNDSGSDNIAIGYQASLFNNDASGNVAIGGESLYNNTSGNRNTVLGYSAGYSNLGEKNVYLGYSAGYSNDGNGNIFIGYAAGYGDTSSSNRLNIGDTIFGDISSKLVGINQITPETTLDVNGTTRITGGLTASTISATTYYNLPGSSSSNCFGTFYTSAISGCSPVTILTPLNLTEGINVTGTTNFTNTVDFSGGLTASTISATTYQNLPISGLTQGSNVTITNNGNGNYTIASTGGGGGLTFQQVQMVAFLSS